MSITCGIDWAEGHHDIAVIDAGTVVARRRIDTGVTGFGQLMGVLAEHVDDPAAVPVAIETHKNLIVVALLAAGLSVYAINPRARDGPFTTTYTDHLTRPRTSLCIGSP